MKKMKNVVLLLACVALFTTILGVTSLEVNADDITSKQVVLVHGGWHGEWSWYKMIDELEQRGYNVHTVELPAHGNNSATAWNTSVDGYVNSILNVLDNIDGKAILVGHGTSGALVSMAADQRPDKISKILYLSGVLAKDNECIATVLLKDTNSNAMANAKVNVIKGTMSISADIVYNTASRGDTLIGNSLINDEPLKPLFEGIKLSDKFYEIPKYYVNTEQDLSVSSSYQEILTEKIPCNEVFSLNSGHVPFISNVAEVANILDEIKDKDETGISPVQIHTDNDIEDINNKIDVEEVQAIVLEKLKDTTEVSFQDYYNEYIETVNELIHE